MSREEDPAISRVALDDGLRLAVSPVDLPAEDTSGYVSVVVQVGIHLPVNALAFDDFFFEPAWPG
jgi:hypothetical protein